MSHCANNAKYSIMNPSLCWGFLFNTFNKTNLSRHFKQPKDPVIDPFDPKSRDNDRSNGTKISRYR